MAILGFKVSKALLLFGEFCSLCGRGFNELVSILMESLFSGISPFLVSLEITNESQQAEYVSVMTSSKG